MSDDCGCCEGVGTVEATPIDNPPGQTRLASRVTTYATSFSAMVAELGQRLAESGNLGTPGRDAAGCLGEAHRSFLLGGEPDAGTALLDAWACVADVLTFYQERIANEGYLRTATEAQSVVELGHLTGYTPRPGVAASVHLAFAVQDGFDGTVPVGTRVQSVPRPGSDPATYETSEAITARAEWNAMAARRRASGRYVRREYYQARTELSHVTGGLGGFGVEWRPTGRIEIFLAGVDHGVAPGAVVLVETGDRAAGAAWTLGDAYRVTDVWPDASRTATTVRLVSLMGGYREGGVWEQTPAAQPGKGFPVLRPTGGVPPRAVPRELDLDGRRDEGVNAIVALAADLPWLGPQLTAALRGTPAEAPPRALVLRSTAQVFGHNAAQPMQSETTSEVVTTSTGTTTTTTTRSTPDSDLTTAGDEAAQQMFLDGDFPTLRPHDPIVVVGCTSPDAYLITAVQARARSAYGLSGKTTVLTLDRDWWSPTASGGDPEFPQHTTITDIRAAIVYAGAEPLALVGEPIEDDVGGSVIDLEGYLTTLPTDRLLIVEGERADLGNVTGVRGVELVRVAAVEAAMINPPRPATVGTVTAPAPAPAPVPAAPAPAAPPGAPPPGAAPAPAPVVDSGVAKSPLRGAAPYTRVSLTSSLRYRYKRATVVVRGNVVHATHGETKDEVLGSGDAAVAWQRFTLKQAPRTWVSAPTPTGVATTLTVRVDGVAWPEVPREAQPGPRDEVVRVEARSDGKEQVVGGDGVRGARLTTGVENVTARYRIGLGAGGNVAAGLITSLVTRPLGVREVVNPLPASGGVDGDGRDETRARIPIAARGADRLVSVQDHAEFALGFAGVQLASARMVPSPTGEPVVEVVIASDEGVPIEPDADLLRNLRAAFRGFGDPAVRVVVRLAEPFPLLLRAGLRIDPRYRFDDVAAAVQARLIADHGWRRRAPGQPAYLSPVIASMQAVAGVVDVDVDVFGPMVDPTATLEAEDALLQRLEARWRGLQHLLTASRGLPTWRFPARPAQLFYFASALPVAVVLKELAP